MTTQTSHNPLLRIQERFKATKMGQLLSSKVKTKKPCIEMSSLPKPTVKQSLQRLSAPDTDPEAIQHMRYPVMMANSLGLIYEPWTWSDDEIDMSRTVLEGYLNIEQLAREVGKSITTNGRHELEEEGLSPMVVENELKNMQLKTIAKKRAELLKVHWRDMPWNYARWERYWNGDVFGRECTKGRRRSVRKDPHDGYEIDPLDTSDPNQRPGHAGD